MLGLALVLVATTAPTALHADEALDTAGVSQRRLPRWLDWHPSLAAAFGVYFVDYIAELESTVRPSADGSDFVITPYVDFVFELMSPELEERLHTSVFVQASVGPSFGQDVVVANEGALSELVFPDAPFFGQGAIQGLGSAVTMESQSPVYGARIGVAVSFPVLQRTLRIKPSVGWSRQAYRASGEVLQVFRPGFAGPNTIVRLKAAETRSFDAVGPGLEIELDLEEKAGFAISGFAYSHVHYMLRARNGTFGAQDAAGRSATFGYHTDEPWHYRLGVGVRVKWLGR